MLVDLRPDGIVGDALVLAPGDEDHLFREAPEPGDGAAGGRGDGVVVPTDAPADPDPLDAVLHAVEAPGHGVHGLRRHQAPDGGEGRHIVLYVVHPGQRNVRDGQDGRHTAALCLIEDAVLQKDAVLYPPLPGKPADLAGSLPGRDLTVGVVRVEDGDTVLPLVQEDILLGLDVLLIALVDVQVVGGEIRHHGDGGAPLHGHQLEGGELQHGVVLRPHSRRVAEQRVTDVAPQPDGLALRLQKLGNDGGGGGLAVAAGDGDHMAGTDLEEGLHLRGQDASSGHGGGDLRYVRPEAGGPEDDVLRQVLEVVLPQAETAAHGGQFIRQRPQRLPALPVPGGHRHMAAQQQFDEGPVADADADDCGSLALQPLEICLKVQIFSLLPSPLRGHTKRLYRKAGQNTTAFRRRKALTPEFSPIWLTKPGRWGMMPHIDVVFETRL